MVQFEYDGVMKRYNVKVPFTLAGETSKITVASISEDNRITLHRELRIDLVRQIFMHWDEYEHQMTREFDDLFSEEDKEYARWELEHDLAKSIDELEVTTRVYDCLQHAGIRTIGELTEKKASEMLKLRNFGRKSLTEVEEILLELSLTLKQ